MGARGLNATSNLLASAFSPAFLPRPYRRKLRIGVHPINDLYAHAIVPPRALSLCHSVLVRVRSSLENHVKVLSEAPRSRYLYCGRCLSFSLFFSMVLVPLRCTIVISISRIMNYEVVNSFIKTLLQSVTIETSCCNFRLETISHAKYLYY